ncbi:MAG: metalloregulator ArsR/SmtB family transcription factor [Candidatus Eisenbacteria bacterium]|nr:metalloregulator ArsR/SmtB family transcription factor [Candidatus Eisenbacteria bacterium]
MKAAVIERYEARAEVMKALAHPSRLYIVDELSRGERCVHELTDGIGSDISTVSKHLRVLRSVGIVAGEKRGSEVYYSLRMACVVDFFGCVEAVLRGGAGAACRVRTAGEGEDR